MAIYVFAIASVCEYKILCGYEYLADPPPLLQKTTYPVYYLCAVICTYKTLRFR